MIKKDPKLRPQSVHEFLSQFNRTRIYLDDPDPQADRGQRFLIDGVREGTCTHGQRRGKSSPF